jgi:hypothetical protein
LSLKLELFLEVCPEGMLDLVKISGSVYSVTPEALDYWNIVGGVY